MDSPSGHGSGREGPTKLERRSFLRWVSGLGAAAIAALMGLPVLRAFVSPVLAKPQADTWIKVADDIALLDVGTPIRVDFVQSTSDAWLQTRALNGVWLFTEDGEKFKAYNGRCTHLGCAYTYDKANATFLCPCHRGQFDVKTGKVLAGPPPRALDELSLEIRDSAVYVRYRDFRLGIAEQVEA